MAAARPPPPRQRASAGATAAAARVVTATPATRAFRNVVMRVLLGFLLQTEHCRENPGQAGRFPLACAIAVQRSHDGENGARIRAFAPVAPGFYKRRVGV